MLTYRRKTVNSLINALYSLKIGTNDNKNKNKNNINLIDLMNKLKISSKRNNLKKKKSKKK